MKYLIQALITIDNKPREFRALITSNNEDPEMVGAKHVKRFISKLRAQGKDVWEVVPVMVSRYNDTVTEVPEHIPENAIIH